MEFKGTKGEWEIRHSESKDAFNVVGTVLGGKYKIARCPYLATDFSEELNKREKSECEANAKLIAAAPELLEALQELLNFNTVKTYTWYDEDVLKAKKAIKKAL